MNSTRAILIIGAMHTETDLLIDNMSVEDQTTLGPFQFFEGSLCGKAAVVCRGLIGTAFASAAAVLGIGCYSPGAVICCGTAGGHSPRLHKGDIVLGQTVRSASRYNSLHRDRGEGSDFTRWEYPEFEASEYDPQKYHYICRGDETLMKAAEKPEYAYGRVVRGNILSSDAWNRELDMISFYHEKLGSDCEDMESFAVAKICEEFSVPCLSVRIISNSELYPEDGCDLPGCGRQCQELVMKLLEYV